MRPQLVSSRTLNHTASTHFILCARILFVRVTYQYKYPWFCLSLPSVVVLYLPCLIHAGFDSKHGIQILRQDRLLIPRTFEPHPQAGLSPTHWIVFAIMVNPYNMCVYKARTHQRCAVNPGNVVHLCGGRQPDVGVKEPPQATGAKRGEP